MNTIEHIAQLHSLYETTIGVTLECNYKRQCQWLEFIRAGFTADDLKLMIWYRRKTVKEPRILANMLKFSFLIGQLDRTEEDIREARAMAKNKPRRTDRTRVLEATGRSDGSVGAKTAQTAAGKTARVVLAKANLSENGTKAFQDFKAFVRQQRGQQ